MCDTHWNIKQVKREEVNGLLIAYYMYQHTRRNGMVRVWYMWKVQYIPHGSRWTFIPETCSEHHVLDEIAEQARNICFILEIAEHHCIDFWGVTSLLNSTKCKPSQKGSLISDYLQRACNAIVSPTPPTPYTPGVSETLPWTDTLLPGLPWSAFFLNFPSTSRCTPLAWRDLKSSTMFLRSHGS